MVEIVQDLRPAEEVVWDYYGTPLKAMRRTQLWRLADIHKIPYPLGCSKDNLLLLLDHHEIQGVNLLSPPHGMTEETFWRLINGPRKEYNELSGHVTDGQTNVDLLRDVLEGKSHFETEQAPTVQPVLTEDAGETSANTVEWQKASVDIHLMSWGELKKEAKGRGLKVPNTMKRPELEALLGDPT